MTGQVFYFNKVILACRKFSWIEIHENFLHAKVCCSTVISKNWDILRTSDDTNFLTNSRTIFGLKGTKTLGTNWSEQGSRSHNDPDYDNHISVLNDTMVPLSESKNKGKNRSCRYCPLLNKSGRVKSTSTGRSYTSLKNITCKSSNLIYLITCKSENCRRWSNLSYTIRKIPRTL